MGQTTQQIEAQIEQTRDHLGSNLNELEHRVKSVTDWRQHFQSSPMTMVGLAFGGGVVLATMLGRRRGHTSSADASRSAPHQGSEYQQNKVLETWENIKGALIGVAAVRFKDFVGELVPGFKEQLEHTEEAARRGISHVTVSSEPRVI